MPPEGPQDGSELEVHLKSSPLGNLSFIREEMVKSMEGVANLVQRHGSSTLLLWLGSGSLVFSVASKFQLSRYLVAELSSAEFIWLLLIGLVLLLAGTGIRVYQFRIEQEFGKAIKEAGIALVSKGMDAGASLVKAPPEQGKPL